MAPVADPGLRWGTRCKMFSHGPMSGAGVAKGLVWYIFSYAKGVKLGPGGGAWPPWPPRIGYWAPCIMANIPYYKATTIQIIRLSKYSTVKLVFGGQWKTCLAWTSRTVFHLKDSFWIHYTFFCKATVSSPAIWQCTVRCPPEKGFTVYE